MTRNNCLYLLMLALITLANVSVFGQTGPGGVGNSSSNFLFLKANAGTSTTTNNASVATWADQSGNLNDATQGTVGSQPKYKSAQINGLPSLSFSGSNVLNCPPSFPTNSDYTKFVVTRVTSVADNNNFFSGSSGHALFLGTGLTNPQLFNGGPFATSIIPLTLNQFAIISGTYQNTPLLGEIFVNGTSGGSGTAPAVNADNSIEIGGFNSANFLIGDLTEVIGYNFSLNTSQRTIVENYLAAKYNLPISNQKYNYAATHSTDVVGIGRVDGSNIHLAARSSNILDINEPAAGSFADGDFLLTGHDNASVSAWTTTEIPASGNIQRLAREWRLTKTGSVTTMTLGIDNTVLPALPSSFTKYVIMVDADGDFSNGAAVYELPSIGGSLFAETGITIADGNFLAIGIVNPTIQFNTATSSALESVSLPVPVTLNYVAATAVTVNYTVADGTATSGSDYTLANGVATIAAGSSTANIVPAIIDDLTPEPDESFTITLSSPSGANLGANTVNTYTIQDDDNALKIQFSTPSANGSESLATVTVTISINVADPVNPTTVDYSVTGGTATGGGVDYTLVNGTATIPATATSTTFNITVVDDAIYEAGETIIISLSNPTNANIGTNDQFTYTINDNEPIPVVGFSGTSASGSESVTTFNFPVTSSEVSYTGASVNYTVTGTATGGGIDYTLANGTFTIPAGSTSGSIIASIIDDSNIETTETIIVTLSSPVNCTLGTSFFTYSILDDDVFGFKGPGGVGDNLSNLLWLKADAGTSTTTDGVPVTTWADQSGSATDATLIGGTGPTYKTAQINGLPVLRFNGTTDFMTAPSVFPINSDFTKVVVTTLNNLGSANNILSGSTGHALFFGGGPFPLMYQGGVFLGSLIPVVIGVPALLSGTFNTSTVTGEIFVNGASGSSAIAGGENTDNTLQIGAFGGSNLLNGDVAEAIAYNVLLNSAQRTIIENYLSSKYNLIIANDKYSFDATHGNEVAGIGRDDVNNFHIDAKGSGLVRINNASSLDDGDYLLWGHNGVTLTANEATDVPAGIVLRMGRVWKADQTANVGTINISFDLTTLSVANGNDIVLLLDNDGVFASGATQYITGRSYNAGTHIVSFTGASLPAGTYFTLGSTTTGTTLPIHLLSFTAVADVPEQVVQINWSTATEINNDFFNIERSATGHDWEQIAKISGAGTSTKVRHYSAIDTRPVFGQSYYRLVQTDYDGHITFSEPVIVNLQQEELVSYYPNPANASLTVSTLKPSQITLMDPTGRIVFTDFISGPTKISTKEMFAGVYILKTDDGKKITTKKIVIVH